MAQISEAIFFVDRGAPTGLQSQIRETLVSGILSGRLIPGARLPSSRRLASYLGIARITVTLAYQELAAQGYIEVGARRVFRISEQAPVKRVRPLETERPDRRIDWEIRLKQRFGGVKPIRKPLDWHRYPYPFLYGQMDRSLFDLRGWRDCARRALSPGDFEHMAGDFAAADDMQLVSYICSRTLPRRGIRAQPEEILVTLGAQNALWLAVQLILRRGAHAACENPCHPDIFAALHHSGAKVWRVDVDRMGLPPGNLPERLDAVVVTPSHQSPTSVRMPLERRQHLLDEAERRDFVILEDDYEFEMSFLAPPMPALKSIDRSGRVFYIGSFSKSLFPGLRLGYLVAPAPVIREARALRALILRHPPGHLQRTAAYFLALGHYDAVIRRMRLAYAERHEVMAASLAAAGLDIASNAASGGTSFWIEGPHGTDADRLVEELRNDGVLIESGSPFFPDPDAPCRFFRMAYSSIPADRIAEGVRRTALVLDNHLPNARTSLSARRSMS